MEKSEERARQLLSWVQNAISSRQLRDPGAVFALSGQVSTLEKRLDKFHKRLAMLDEAVDKDAVVDIISDIINDVVLTTPSNLCKRQKGKAPIDSSASGSSSGDLSEESSDGPEIHVKRSCPNKKVHPHKRRQSVQTSDPSPEQGSGVRTLQFRDRQAQSYFESCEEDLHVKSKIYSVKELVEVHSTFPQKIRKATR
ncbi:unnamed protein product [Rhizophagus irregularis]|nr:unnamed protein product [Rhizophagus irregularis]